MKKETLPPTDYRSSLEQWEKYSYRNLWQHPSWAEFQNSIGRKTFFLSTEKAYALLVRHALPMGLCYLEIPRGPLFESASDLAEMMKKIQKLAHQEKAIFIRMSPYSEFNTPSLSTDVPDLRFRTASGDHHPETSLMIDLSPSEESILEQMKPKGRYNMRLAQKHGISVEASEDVSSFYEILRQTGKRDGFGIHPQSHYEKMLQALGDKAQLLVARYEDRVIAGGIFVYLEEWGIYYYGASDHHYRKYMAPYLIQWTAIQEAKKRECRFYDFLGIGPDDSKDHPWAGVTSFKKKFGGQAMHYPPAKDLVISRFWYFLYRLKKRFS